MWRHRALTLTTDERRELERRVRSRKMRAEDSRRARVILVLADGESFTTITTAVGCYPDYVSRWKQRFEAERLTGLRAQYRGQPPTGANARAGGAAESGVSRCAGFRTLQSASRRPGRRKADGWHP